MKILVANYKMHLGVRESVALARGVLLGIRGNEHLPEIVLCPTHTALAEVRKIVARSHVQLGAQNVAAEPDGALTGEVSAMQLADVGCSFVLVGHSERRRALHETDADVHAKVLQAHAAGIVPIVCVGESAEERGAGKAEHAVRAQVRAALGGVQQPRKLPVLLAYEPMWAIGAGKGAEPGDVVAMHRVVREAAAEALHVDPSTVGVLYGGSVTGDNAYAYLREKEVNGVLVGGASVKIQDFLRVLGATVEVMIAQS